VIVPVEPIVSEDLWERCDAILATQRSQAKPPPRKVVHLFAGLARCGCGTKMYVRAGSPKYVCEGCRNKIPVADLEAVFLSELNRFLLSPAEIDAHARATDGAIREKEALIARALSDLRKLEAKEDQLFELHSSGSVAKDDFARRHKPISERRRQLDDELPRLQADLDVMRISSASQEEAILSARTLTEGWASLTQTQKRQMIEATTSRIVVSKDEIEIDLISLPTTHPLGLTAETSDQRATHPQGFIAATSCTRAG
jgi:site-specific DNA recombinase